MMTKKNIESKYVKSVMQILSEQILQAYQPKCQFQTNSSKHPG